MPRTLRNGLLTGQSMPQRSIGGAGLPTPPEEDWSLPDAVFLGSGRIGSKEAQSDIDASKAHPIVLKRQLGRAESWKAGWGQGRRNDFDGQDTARERELAEEQLASQCLRQERDQLAYRVLELEASLVKRTNQQDRQTSNHEVERRLWEAHAAELQLENQHLRHSVYVNALHATISTPLLDTDVSDRSETRSLRQQLAHMDERCHSMTDKMVRLQDQTTEARRLLARERQDRLEERNNQLTVVVAKHRLERRMRDRESNLQTEWRRNAELTEKCQKLEEDLAEAKKAGNTHYQRQGLSLRGLDRCTPTVETPAEDDWDDRPGHLPPELGYSKFVRWKKRAREGHDYGAEIGKKQRTTAVDTGRLQLAGSESPPHVVNGTEEAASGASAIDQMVSGEFTESENPSRAATPGST